MSNVIIDNKDWYKDTDREVKKEGSKKKDKPNKKETPSDDTLNGF